MAAIKIKQKIKRAELHVWQGEVLHLTESTNNN